MNRLEVNGVNVRPFPYLTNLQVDRLGRLRTIFLIDSRNQRAVDTEYAQVSVAGCRYTHKSTHRQKSFNFFKGVHDDGYSSFFDESRNADTRGNRIQSQTPARPVCPCATPQPQKFEELFLLRVVVT